jgi:xanthine dehydrogenase molybdopterin-binding subunit B
MSVLDSPTAEVLRCSKHGVSVHCPHCGREHEYTDFQPDRWEARTALCTLLTDRPSGLRFKVTRDQYAARKRAA